MPILETDKIGVVVNQARLLKEISISIEAGETLAVVGPNGAGKTSLVKAICGDLKVDEGQVLLCNKPLERWSLSGRARCMAILPQASSLGFPYVVEEVVALGRTPHSSGLAVDQVIITEAMAALDISYLRGRLYTELSGGEKQRTQLARVMAQVWRADDASGRLLLLDEPTSALDLGHQQQLMQAIKGFADNQVGVLFIAHDINLAIANADKLLALSCGEVAAYGPPQEVVSEELLHRLFNAQVNVIKHPVSGKKVVLA